MALDRNLAAAIAVTRFGLGAKPGEILTARDDPEAWLQAQIRPGVGADQPQPGATGSAERVRSQFRDYQTGAAGGQGGRRQTFDPVKVARKLIRRRRRRRLPRPRPAGRDHRRRLPRALGAVLVQPLHRLGRPSCRRRPLVGPFEREAIRPHVFGRFEDMLVASSSHPGMLLYLDQAQSVGPDTMAADASCRAAARRPA